MNYFDGNLSVQAAGIVATLFALCQLIEEHHRTDIGAVLADKYHALRDFAAEHVDANQILRAID